MHFAGWSQDGNNLAVDATVKDDDGNRLAGVTISLYQDQMLVNKVTTGKNGRFDLFLDFEHEFTIEISKPGYVTKKLYVNTENVPEEEQAWGYEFGGFDVEIFKEMPGMDLSILEQPVGKVYYDERILNFEYDREYTKLIKAQLDQVEEEYNRRKEAERERQEQLEEDYQLALNDAKAAFDAKDYLSAKEHYVAASGIKPEEAYPKQQIEQIDVIIAKQGETEEKYLAALATADQLFTAGNFSEAKASYQQALTFKPLEQYPKDRIAEADKQIALLAQQQQEQQKLEQDYQKAIVEGDAAFKSQQWEQAKTSYGNALVLKPEETYPQAQLDQIGAQMAALAKAAEEAKAEQEVDAQYADAIASADKAFNADRFSDATELYKAASAIKPGEKYPNDQLAVIGQKLAELAAQEQKALETAALEEKYEKAIAAGDGAFSSGDYDAAKSSYNLALTIKPGEAHPTSQIKKIDNLLAEAAQIEQERLEKQRQYNDLIAQADKAFASQAYTESLDSYKQALALKPDEKLPQQKINEIELLLNEQEKMARQDQLYLAAITAADGFFDKNDFTAAKEKYTEALGIRPTESYPKQKLDEIETKLLAQANAEKEKAAQAELEQQYTEAIARADKAFQDERYDEAKAGYQNALKIKGNEVYPVDQIALIEEKLTSIAKANAEEEARKELDVQYGKIISEADALFNAEDYNASQAKYEAALVLKPGEQYPTAQLALISEKLGEIAALEALEKLRQERYEKAMSKANTAFAAEDYSDARKGYEDALQEKPDDPTAQNRISEINAILEKQQMEMAARDRKIQEKENQYNNYIKLGDDFIKRKEYDKAEENFRAAAALFNDRTYATEKIQLVERLRQELAESQKRESYNLFIAEADAFFRGEQYEQAREVYQKALDLYDEPHPKAQLTKIDEILASLADGQKQVQKQREKVVTEETYKEGTATVTVRKVKVGDKEDVYKKVQHVWGGLYFFLNDRPITELVWERETSQ